MNSTTSKNTALEGIKVLDLSREISGPYCTKLLAAFGAEVIKAEPPGRGDNARDLGSFLNDQPNSETSAVYLYLNTGKKSITLNLKTPAGKDLLRRLIVNSDVVVENFPPGRLDGLGLGYQDLCGLNPAVIMASITDFGQYGPYREYHGGRLVANALSGYLYVNGDPDKEPLAGGGEQPAYQGGLHAYTAIMAALVNRQITGRGRYIDISIQECMTSLHQFTVNRFVYSGKIQKRMGNRHLWAHPVTIYPCRDGEVAVCAGTEDQAQRLFLLMDMPHLTEDPRFATGPDRRRHADELDALIRPWFLERTRAEIVENCQEWRVPAAGVNDVCGLFNDPQYQGRMYWVALDHPVAGRFPYAGAPFKLSETPAQYQRAPLLGEHNAEIYLDGLGLSTAELNRLKGEGIV